MNDQTPNPVDRLVAEGMAEYVEKAERKAAEKATVDPDDVLTEAPDDVSYRDAYEWRRVEAAVVPPTCAWCPDPAAEQVLTGRRPTPDGKTRAVYAWMCDPCATYFKDEKEYSRRG